jgi:hypothetical protein
VETLQNRPCFLGRGGCDCEEGAEGSKDGREEVKKGFPRIYSGPFFFFSFLLPSVGWGDDCMGERACNAASTLCHAVFALRERLSQPSCAVICIRLLEHLVVFDTPPSRIPSSHRNPAPQSSFLFKSVQFSLKESLSISLDRCHDGTRVRPSAVFTFSRRSVDWIPIRRTSCTGPSAVLLVVSRRRRGVCCVWLRRRKRRRWWDGRGPDPGRFLERIHPKRVS